MPNTTTPTRIVPVSLPMRAKTTSPTTVWCSCGASHAFAASHDFAKDLMDAGWTWERRGGSDHYLCPECSRPTLLG
ncbi:MAG: hypothetical protein M3O36_18130 [Myxococcota bacterium]|nr:hypothetical protein [Myxococcota bacterium]